MSTHLATSSDIFSTLVEVDFDKDYIIHMMMQGLDGSLFHVIYDCLYADYSPEESSVSSSAPGQKALSEGTFPTDLEGLNFLRERHFP